MTYLDDIGAQIRARVPDHLISPESDGLFTIYAVLLLAKGQDVTSSDVHDAWAAWMQIRGIRHPSMIPYDELSSDIQREDDIFAAAIRAAVSRD